MNKNLVLGMAGIVMLGCNSRTNKQPPNIILIVADDLGFSDLGCYGGEIQTPNLDRLAKNGLRFTQFYNASRSCPTRASLLTGLYPHQAGIGHMTEDKGYPAYSGELTDKSPTIAEVLRKSGYLTFMTGKWHVTLNVKPSDPNCNRPLKRGFNHYFGTLPGSGSYWDPAGLMEDDEFIKADGDFYYTEKISEYACNCIKDASATESPFFLYVAYSAPHYPLHARDEVIRKYEDVYATGWDSIRSRRYRQLLKYGLIDPVWSLSERDQMSHPWDEDTLKHWEAHRMSVFAAAVDHLDQGVGRIIRELESSREIENSVIIFFSDNGGTAEGHLYNTVERLGIPWVSSLIPDSTRDNRLVKSGDWPGEHIGGPETYGGYGPEWSNVSNTPFRLFKSWVHEGGISSPLIVHWPAGFKARNELRQQVAHVIDIMPTILDITGATYPEEFNGYKTIPLEGISLLPFLSRNKICERTLFWEHEGNKAIRKGDRKLVMENGGEWNRNSEYLNKWELYDMKNDRTETRNLARDEPGLVRELEMEWNNWAERCGVMPWEIIRSK
jgi:arylsulfatase A-like enzyme